MMENMHTTYIVDKFMNQIRNSRLFLNNGLIIGWHNKYQSHRGIFILHSLFWHVKILFEFNYIIEIACNARLQNIEPTRQYRKVSHERVVVTVNFSSSLTIKIVIVANYFKDYSQVHISMNTKVLATCGYGRRRMELLFGPCGVE